MPQTTAWGQTYKVLLDTGFLVDVFKLDQSTLDGPDVLDGSTDFADVTQYVTNVSIRRGRPDQLSAMPIGQASITLDDGASGRAFDPANTASPYFEGGYGIAPRRFVQIYGGTAGNQPLFIGRVNDLDIQYEKPNNSFANISCVDDLSAFARTNLIGFTPTQQLSSERVSAILNRTEVSYSTATRSFETGVATVGAVPYQDNVNVKAALDAVVQAEDGRFFVSRGGTAIFQSRIQFSFSTATLSFSDVPSGSAYGYQDLSVSYGSETLYNRIQIGVQGLAVSTAVNQTSVDEFGVNTLTLTDVPLATQAAGSTLADNLLQKYGNPVFRFDEIGLSLNGLSSSAGQAISTLEIGDLISVTKRYLTGSPGTVTETMYVESIRHEISPSQHRVNLGLGQAQLFTPFILNTSLLDGDDRLG